LQALLNLEGELGSADGSSSAHLPPPHPLKHLLHPLREGPGRFFRSSLAPGVPVATVGTAGRLGFNNGKGELSTLTRQGNAFCVYRRHLISLHFLTQKDGEGSVIVDLYQGDGPIP
jgi:hypothetical protein